MAMNTKPWGAMLTAFLLTVPICGADAHEIVLKDGRRIVADRIRHENGFVLYTIPGGELGIRANQVERIVREASPQPRQPMDRPPEQQPRLLDAEAPRNPVEAAVLATVSVISPVSTASGFFVSEDGYILTNRHVIRVDRGRLDEAEQRLQESSARVDRLEREVRTLGRRIAEDERWLPRAKAEIDRRGEQRRFDSSAKARRHIQETNDRVEAYNRRLTTYYQRHTSYAQLRGRLNAEQEVLEQERQGYADLARRSQSREKPDITLADGTRLTVGVTAVSPRYDVALLKLDGYRTPFIQAADPLGMALAEPVYAIGNPTGELPNTVSAGRLKNVISQGILSGHKGEFLQSDARIYPGNSGGPLVDGQGRVVGINTMKELTRNFEGLGYALSIRIAMGEFADILQLPVAP